jgi:hypothetical protein
VKREIRAPSFTSKIFSHRTGVERDRGNCWTQEPTCTQKRVRQRRGVPSETDYGSIYLEL